MTIYDISQEVFSCRVFPGDPAPERRVLSSMEKGDLYNLTAFNMCAHNGTHVDAPFHFLLRSITGLSPAMTQWRYMKNREIVTRKLQNDF